VDVASGRVRTVVEKGTIKSISVVPERIVYALEHLRSPAELYSVRPDGSDVTTLTRINAEKVAAARMGKPEQFTFKGARGDVVFCTVVKPVNFDPAKKCPVAFLIHGGPQGSFGNDFHYRWNPQTYAGAGYATVAVDFHGSTGYGQAFHDTIRRDWGGKPLEDLKKGLEAALQRCPRMDGTPWSNPQEYEKQNPVNFVKNWKAPTLVVHGGRDYRIPYVNGISTFTALQRLGGPSRFLCFPDENHWVLKPRNSILWHETVIGWLDQWTKK
jgi:dipeptidyl aminopeptidase/acylaminoacyl peptidase